MATEIEKDPFPAWKMCYYRKAKEGETTYFDLVTHNDLRNCDWYQCENGHLYAIGECRLPVMMGKCPTCGTSIGGKWHKMLKSNKRKGAISNWRNVDKSEMSKLKKIKIHEVESFISRKKKNMSVDLVDDFEDVDVEVDPEMFCCPITLNLMKDPVYASDGHTYERSAIKKWVKEKGTSPVTNEKLTLDNIHSNDQLKDRIELFLDERERRKGKKFIVKGKRMKRKKKKRKKKKKEKDDNEPSAPPPGPGVL